MATYTIQTRKKSDGTARYRCIVRIGGGKQLDYTESKTFGKKQQAKAWGDASRLRIGGAWYT